MASRGSQDHQVHQICGNEGTSVWTVIYVGDEGHFMQHGPTSLGSSGRDRHHHQISVHIYGFVWPMVMNSYWKSCNLLCCNWHSYTGSQDRERSGWVRSH
jgi:hypothetical protein